MDLLIPPAPETGNVAVELVNTGMSYSTDNGERWLFRNMNLSLRPGQCTGIVGRNGVGKTTLLRLCLGEQDPVEGTVTIGKRVVFNYIDQGRIQLNGTGTVMQEISDSGGMVKFGDQTITVRSYLRRFLFDESRVNERVDKLSGGERARLILAKVLCRGGNVIVLDEPTNDLDLSSLRMLEEALAAFAGTVLVVSHDRYFLDNAAEWILELDRGHGIPYKGNYSSWLEQKDARLALEQRTEDARAKAMKKELEWVRQNAKGRQSKSKARLARFEELSDYEYQKRNETQEIFIPVAERLGTEVIEFKNVSKSFGDRMLIDDLSFRIPAGAIVGIIGPNGAGKSTLFKLIRGIEQPDTGEITRGQTVQIAFVDQHRDDLDNDKTVWEDVSGGLDMITVGKFQMPSRAYCGRFNFNGGDQQKRVGMLSGGERGRLHLAKTLAEGGNVLLLDEPSNDLDVETLRSLEDALLEFAGCALVISHDRWFLDRIATHILACEGDSKWTFFDGNYHEYEADKVKRLGAEGAQPKRIRYKALK